MSNKKKELTYNERCKIELMYKKKLSYKCIATELNVNCSTISREIKKGLVEQKDTQERTYFIYLADYAELKSKERKSRRGALSKLKVNSKFLLWATEKIKKEKYSPNAVVMEARRDKLFTKDEMICAWSIYRYIALKLLPNISSNDLHYRRQNKQHYKRAKRPPKYKTIEDRPKEILERKDFGHWEMDTVVGLRGKTKESLLVLTERKYRIEIIFLLKEHTMACVVEQLNKLERILKGDFYKIFKTITVDNGVEFSDYDGMMKSIVKGRLRTEIYYCHPYSSSERGSNENANRLIRYFLPKGYDFTGITESEVRNIQDWMNSYPRQILGGANAKSKLLEEAKKNKINIERLKEVISL